jgi:hypothetical protein
MLILADIKRYIVKHLCVDPLCTYSHLLAMAIIVPYGVMLMT